MAVLGLAVLLPRITSGCVWVGFLDIIALEKLLLFDETLELSLCRCLILISPLCFCFNSLQWNAVFSSVVFSYGCLCANFQRDVLSSALVPNFAIPLFSTRTSVTPRSWMTAVVGEVRSTVFPGSHVSQSPLRPFLNSFVIFRASFTSSEELGSLTSDEG